MPTAVMAQPMMMASGPAPEAMFCGRLNTPEPTIEPMTSAVSAPSWSFDCLGVEVEVTDAEGMSVAAIADLPEFGPFAGRVCRNAPHGFDARQMMPLGAVNFVTACAIRHG